MSSPGWAEGQWAPKRTGREGSAPSRRDSWVTLLGSAGHLRDVHPKKASTNRYFIDSGMVLPNNFNIYYVPVPIFKMNIFYKNNLEKEYRSSWYLSRWITKNYRFVDQRNSFQLFQYLSVQILPIRQCPPCLNPGGSAQTPDCWHSQPCNRIHHYSAVPKSRRVRTNSRLLALTALQQNQGWTERI